MCGISGYVSIYNRKKNLSKSLISISHRGPDNLDSYHYNNSKFNIGFAHARLSIIDISKRSNQPLISSCKNYLIIYNGEIYNFLELRKKLELKGVKFQTKSDTEVILEYYKMFGSNGFVDLDGIFSFSLLDKKNNKIYLVRDHIGVKPLYYYYDKKNEEIYYSSEIKGLKSFESIDFSISKNDVYEFFNCGWLYEPNTGFKHIKKVKPGSYLKVDLNNFKIKIKSYFDKLNYKSNNNKNFKKIITENINSQLISDVPLGLFFSGGIDSSLIAAFSKQKINSISVSYSKKELNESGIVDDYPFQEKISKKLKFNTIHKFFDKKSNNKYEILNSFKKVALGIEELNCDLTYLPSLKISSVARHNNFKVMLSGMGGDEMFGGYPRYLLCRYYYFFLCIYYLIKPFNFLIKLNSNYSKKIERFNSFFEEKSFGLKYSRLVGYFNSNELKSLFINKKLKDKFKKKLNKILLPVSNLSLFKKALFLDTTGFLTHNLIVADKSSMNQSIELRVPLLSKNIISKVFKTKDSEFINFGKLKFYLKKMLELKLPNFLIYRTKTGFNPPLDNKINILGEELIIKTLEKSNIYNFVTKTEVKNIVKSHFNKKNNNTYKIFLLLYFSFWLNENC